MTAKDIMAYVPKANGQTVMQFCIRKWGDSVGRDLEWSIERWVKDILEGNNEVLNGEWKTLPFIGTRDGFWPLTEEGNKKAKNSMMGKRFRESQDKNAWKGNYKHSYRVMKVYKSDRFYCPEYVPTLAQVKKALETLNK